jgi:hypothetical protein
MLGRPVGPVGGLADGPVPVGVRICAAAGNARPNDKAARLAIAINCFIDIAYIDIIAAVLDIAAILAEPLAAA